MVRRRLAAAALALASLGGCAAEEPTARPETTAASVVASTSTVPATTPAAPATAAAKPVVVLEPGGLGFLVSGASIRRVPFGSSDTETIRTALISTLGPPLEEEDQSCGSGPIRSMRWSAITAYTGAGKFVGWFVRADAKPALTTANGVGIGMTLAKLGQAHPDVKVEKTSLGDEWSIGTDLGGTLTKNSPNGTVNAIFSGDACIAR